MITTKNDIDQLFRTMPFGDAKKELIDFLERNGHTISGNEMVFELKSKCVSILENQKTNDDPDVVQGSVGNPDAGVSNSSSSVITDDLKVDPNEEQDLTATNDTPQIEPNDNNDAQQNNDTTEPVEPKKRGRKKKDESDTGNIDKNIDKKRNEIEKRLEQIKAAQEELEKLEEEKRKIEEEEERKRKEEEEKKQAALKQNEHKSIDEIVNRLKCLHKAFLVGPAGTGKSTLAMEACAKLFNIEGGADGAVMSDKFAQISFSPDTVSSDMIGFKDVNGVFHETDIVRVFRDGGLILFDEMDDADASLLVKLNTMLANGVIPTPDGVVKQNENTYIVGTANTFGKGGNSMYVGRNRLDAATLDRWKLATIKVNYDTDFEDKMIDALVADKKSCEQLKAIRTSIRACIENNKYKQICSTRFVVDSIKLINSGYSMTKIVNTFLLDWDEQSSKLVKTEIKRVCNDILNI